MNINLPFTNFLVTGGTGFIGQYLAESLANLDKKVIILDIYRSVRHSISSVNKRKINFIKEDIRNYQKLSEIISQNNIEFIFHLAAQTLVEKAYNHPKNTLDINIMGTVNILETVRRNSRIKGVVIASSDKAYGKEKTGNKYLEHRSLAGDHPYEVSKSAADLIATAYFKTYNLPITVSRCANVYGEGDLNFSRIIPGIMKSLITGQVLKIRSNGLYVRDYIYIKDVIKGYLHLASSINNIRGEAFNFGSKDTLTVMELIRKIEKVLKKQLKYRIINTAKNEIFFQSLNSDKANKKLNWKPDFSVESTVEKIFKWYTQKLIN